MNDIPEEDRVKLRIPPSTMTSILQDVWVVVQPQVYRYEDQHWIDEFFETGKLRLSSFAKFATYEDEARGDDQEGRALCYGETTNGKGVGIFQQEGINGAVFCASHRLGRDLADAFGRNSAFQVMDTPKFAFEIKRRLPGFRGGIEGSCIYRNDPIIKRALDFELDLEKEANPDSTINIEFYTKMGEALGGPELVLLKRKRFEKQQEYRLIWELDEPIDGHIDIVAPLARQYCRKVEPGEWE